jgi:uncharacterized membrane protein YfcA
MMDTNLLLYGQDILVGGIIGVVIGLTGIGGGALIQPALVYIVGLTPVEAVGTGLLYATITKIGGVFGHYMRKTIRTRRVLLFLAGSVPGALAAAESVNYLNRQFDTALINWYLQGAIGVVLIGTSLLIIAQSFLIRDREAQQEWIVASRMAPLDLRTMVEAVGSGLMVGVLVGATSVGGGVLIIPIFLLFLDADTQQAVGSSIAISLVLSCIGGVVYLLHGNVALRTLLLLCLGSLPGVYLGCCWAVRIPERGLRVAVVTIVVGSGIALLAGLLE